jgi:hypothetical protein
LRQRQEGTKAYIRIIEALSRKVNSTSETKNKEFILYFARFTLPLHNKYGKEDEFWTKNSVRCATLVSFGKRSSTSEV